MNDRLVIRRGSEALVIKPRAKGFDMTTSGGGNITAAEFETINAYVAGKPGAEAFLAKVQTRMER